MLHPLFDLIFGCGIMDMTDELNSLFHKITMEDKERFDEALSDIYIEACDYVFRKFGYM